MISDAGNSIVLLERTNCPEMVSFARFGLNGQVLAKGSLESPDASPFCRLSSPGDPAMDADGWATTWSYSGSSILQVQYNPIEDKSWRLAQSGQNYSHGLYRGQGEFFRNGTAYFWTGNQYEQELDAAHLPHPFATHAAMGERTRWGNVNVGEADEGVAVPNSILMKVTLLICGERPGKGSETVKVVSECLVWQCMEIYASCCPAIEGICTS